MAGSAYWTIKDFAGQTSNFQVDIADLTAGNIATVIPLVEALQTAYEGITLGRTNKMTVVAQVDEITTAKASDGAARRELKWELTYVDTVTGKAERRELPCPDVTDEALFESDGEHLNLTAGAGLAFKTAFQAVAKSAVGNSVTLTSCMIKGRNL